jgi:hypothetical protein
MMMLIMRIDYMRPEQTQRRNTEHKKILKILKNRNVIDFKSRQERNLMEIHIYTNIYMEHKEEGNQEKSQKYSQM